MYLLTQINDFQHGEKPVLKVQVLSWCFGTVIFYKGETACPQYLVVGTFDTPVKVGQSELVVVNGAVADTEWSPRGEFTLQQVAGQHLRGSWALTCPPQCAREQGDLQKDLVQRPQKFLHYFQMHRLDVCSSYFTIASTHQRWQVRPPSWCPQVKCYGTPQISSVSKILSMTA